MEPKHERKGIPALADFMLPSVDSADLCAVLLCAIDAARVRGKSEGVAQVVTIIDSLKGRDGCVAVDVLKRVLREKGL